METSGMSRPDGADRLEQLDGPALTRALTRLRAELGRVRLPLPVPGSDAADRTSRETAAQLDDYVLPRLATLEAPLLAVVGGSTGAGKSTLVNSLVRRVVTAPGVIRPTTKAPVLVHHPDDAAWFADDRILPGLPRATGADAGPRSLRLVAEPHLPPGLALLDAPDVDSVDEGNRTLAAQLLAAADLWLFTTSAARYADAVPWSFLLSAAERSAAVGVVVDRVPPGAVREIAPDLGRMMEERGLGDAPLFAVPEAEVDADGLLPDAAVAPVRAWLGSLAADARSRREVVARTLGGAISTLAPRVQAVAAAADAQVAAVRTLRDDADSHWREAARAVAVQTEDGSLLRGEVLNRWHDFVGSGEFLRSLEQRVGWVRDRVVGFFRGEPPQADELKVAVEDGLESVIRSEGERAVERVEAAWRAHPVGRVLLETTRTDLTRTSREFDAGAERVIRDWQRAVLDLVSAEGASKRSRARFLALGVNGVGVALMVLVFAQTGGLVGAEIGVAGGTAVVAQSLLEAVFGDEAVRRLARTAKDDLDGRVEALMAAELTRYHEVLAELALDPELAERLRRVADDVVAAEHGRAPAVETTLAEDDPRGIEAPAPEPPAELALEAAPVEAAPVEAAPVEAAPVDSVDAAHHHRAEDR